MGLSLRVPGGGGWHAHSISPGDRCHKGPCPGLVNMDVDGVSWGPVLGCVYGYGGVSWGPVLGCVHECGWHVVGALSWAVCVWTFPGGWACLRSCPMVAAPATLPSTHKGQQCPSQTCSPALTGPVEVEGQEQGRQKTPESLPDMPRPALGSKAALSVGSRGQRARTGRWKPGRGPPLRKGSRQL